MFTRHSGNTSILLVTVKLHRQKTEDIFEANLLVDKEKASVVDKIHYQKHRSEDIAAKAKKDWINLNIKLNCHQSLI